MPDDGRVSREVDCIRFGQGFPMPAPANTENVPKCNKIHGGEQKNRLAAIYCPTILENKNPQSAEHTAASATFQDKLKN